MKIVYLNPVGVLGGAERVLLSILGEVRRHRPEAELVLVAGTDGPLLERAHGLGVEPVLLPMNQSVTELGDSEWYRGVGLRLDWLRRAGGMLPSAWEYASRLRHLLGRLAPDLIHSNGLKMHLYAGLTRPAGVPVVWHLHDFYGLRFLAPLLLRSARRGIRGAIAVSKAVARDARYILPGLPIEVIYNTVDTDIFCPRLGDGAELDCLAGLPPLSPGAIRVGLIATYAHWKGHDVFLAAAARLAHASAAIGTRFYIIGGPIYVTRAQFTEARLRSRAAEFGISDRVGFVPFQLDTARVYRTLDVVVHASTLPEPFGLTVAEAMACGRAVIVSRAGGAAELFTHDVDGIGVMPGDVVGLADAIRRLSADPDARSRLGTSARATALRRFHPARLGPQILGFYERVLKRRRNSLVS